MKHATLAISVLLPVFVVASCTATTEGEGRSSSSAGSSEGQGGAGTGVSSGSGAQGGFTFTTSAGTGASGGSSSGDGGGCVGTVQTATLVPLDMYIMLDTSGSMLEATASGVSKWNAVKGAFASFFQDAGSDGMGVGLQYFPLKIAGVPDSCTNNTQCGANGPCALKVCTNSWNYCATNQNCPGGSCVTVGKCSNDPNYICRPTFSSFCSGGLGQCQVVTTAFCVNQFSCDVPQYAAPAVNIDLLPGTAQSLIASMNAQAPIGPTPTAAALSGALDQAKAYAAANPTHKVVAVLATDGLPTLCMPQDFGGISSIAQTALNGTPSVSTFVIGVFAGNDMTAKMNLDQLAAAGGTNQAFIVDTSQNVEQAFLAALNAIRGQKLACEYLIPTPPPGETLDYGKVNVEHTPMGSATPNTIFYVGSAANCNATSGGWYYDADPAAGGSPTKIEICPATCDVFGMGGQINISLGCATVPIPK